MSATSWTPLFLHMTDGVVAFSQEGGVIQKNPGG